MKYASLEERIIWNSVLSTDSFYNGTPCWIWIGKMQRGRNGALYPAMTIRYKSGLRKGKVASVRVHRKVIEVFKGRRMTPRMVGLHLCNTTMCVNPDHLHGGTQKKNMRQCVNEGRHKTPFRDPERRVAM